ncbi:hypothetical protein NicSoilC5_30480 [Arthrobacter sp. NicSoilC5]|nr:hypothetical protein NicSoilC5_30480 [Arthrobacter sp. NicSoilC5]
MEQQGCHKELAVECLWAEDGRGNHHEDHGQRDRRLTGGHPHAGTKAHQQAIESVGHHRLYLRRAFMVHRTGGPLLFPDYHAAPSTEM